MHINNQTILHFVNLWSKEVPLNISYPRMFNKIDGYLDGRISSSSVRYIIVLGIQMNYKDKIRNKSQGLIITGY